MRLGRTTYEARGFPFLGASSALPTFVVQRVERGVGRTADATQTHHESWVLQPIQSEGELMHRTVYINVWCIRTALGAARIDGCLVHMDKQ